MIEECPIPGTQVVQTVFTVWCLQKTVLWTFAVARVTNFTVEAVLRKRIQFGVAKFLLSSGIHQILQRNDIQISQQVVWFHEVIATVHVSVVFHRQCATARAAKDAQRRFNAHPCTQRLIEYLHEYATNVSLNPFIKHVD